MTAFAGGNGRFSNFTRSLAAVLVGLLMAPAYAVAGPPTGAPPGKQKIVVIGFGGEEGVAKHAARLEWEADQNARGVEQYEVLDLVALLDPEGHKVRQDSAEQARKSLAAARGAYDELEVQLAIDLCDRAMGLFEKSDVTETLPDMVKAWTLKIAALIANADTKTSNIEQNLLHPLDVEPNFDPNLFAPDFIAQSKRKKDELMAKANLSMDVATKPIPARVYVDGKFRGISPTEVKGLAPGDHFVTLTAPGYKHIQTRSKAGAAASLGEKMEPTASQPKFQSLVQRIQQSFNNESRAAPSRELAQLLGADQLVYVSVNREGPGAIHVAAARVRGSDGSEIGFQEETFTDDESRLSALSKDLFQRLLTSDVRNRSLARALGATQPASGGESSGIIRYTGYGLVGGGLAALAVGVVMGVLANGAASDYAAANLAQTSPQLAELKSTGESRAFIADLSFIGALVLGGAGGIMVALDNRGSGDKASDAPAPASRPVESAPAVRESRPAPVERPPEPAPAPKVEERKPEPPPAPKVEEKKPEPAPAPKVEEKKPEPPPAPKVEEKKPEPPPPAPKVEEKKPEEKKPEPKKDALPGDEGKFKDDYLDDFRDDD